MSEAAGDPRLSGPITDLVALAPKCIASTFDKGVYGQAGVFVLRDAFPEEEVARWTAEWSRFRREQLSVRNVSRFNPVAVGEEPSEELRTIYRSSSLLDVAEQIFGPDIALYNFRFVIKDEHARAAVFKHQDICYHVGQTSRASFFVPLSRVNVKNGGMRFYLGTNHFGYLGDAGELSDDLIASDWPTLSPDLKPGDLAIMDSFTWHDSAPHVEGEDRVMADIHLQPAGDPSGIELLRGRDTAQYRLPREMRERLFKNSRVTRLRALQAEVDVLKGNVPK